jgi:hypothetical protein
MGKNRTPRTFEIALSGICCAVAAGALALGLLSGYLIATGYLIGIVALMVPLSKQLYRGAFLAYVGTVILAIVLGAVVRFWDLVPFAMFFGIHPLVNALQLKYRINKWLAYAVKALWFDGTLIAAYFLIYVVGDSSSRAGRRVYCRLETVRNNFHCGHGCFFALRLSYFLFADRCEQTCIQDKKMNYENESVYEEQLERAEK